ncbi:E3 ubiquitin-protein ligase KEG [Cocos nucifera]|uniref:E3 ubiquitin-protein ligase KEG n=1 Tax=Cocos nucifera TaxID=13894 RepID=A0A8K0HVG9_COCNU|nr:E3 ubiquitin-protein ligase KEG [Cocos nucifera]
MAGKVSASQAAESFEYMLFEGDPDHLRAVVSTPKQISPWIDSNALKLTHRIGRGPFGDVWIATHHHCTEDYDRFHEVAVKMLCPIKDDQLQLFLVKFDEMFSKCHGLESVCFLHGISIQNGRVCIAMKFYEGSIGDKMACLQGGRLALSDVLRYGVDLAQGIMELHTRGILILNLKPCNFLLDEHDCAVLGDFGIPSLLLGLSLPSSDLVQRLGTPNYMAPEQWQPNIRGPISFETDSWGFGCSIVEMLSGIQPWRGKSSDEIYHLVVIKKEKPEIPSGLPPQLENVLYGCFEYDLRNRPLMSDILGVFQSYKDAVSSESSWNNSGSQVADKSYRVGYTDWSLLKDHILVGDTVCSRKPRTSCRLESMEIPEGTVVGMEKSGDHGGFVLVRVHGFHDPVRVHSSTVKRVTYGFAAGDWVRLKEDKRQSPIGILHSIERDGTVTVGFIGMETLWKGNYSEIQMAEPYCVGQFLRLKATVSSPRFEWPRKRGGEWATGRISQVLPNGCLVVRFPGRLSFGEASGFLADPSEVEVVSFNTCEGVVKKYQHLEDFHWAVRPLLIALGLFTALKLGFFVGKSVGRSRRKSGVGISGQGEGPQQDGPSGGNAAWLPPSVANILFKEGVSPAR